MGLHAPQVVVDWGMATIYSDVKLQGTLAIIPRDSGSLDSVSTARVALDKKVTRKIDKTIILEADAAETVSLHDLPSGADFLYWQADYEVTAVITTAAGAATIAQRLYVFEADTPITALTLQRPTGQTTRVQFVAAQS